jgi:hypothetical protein
MGFSFAWVGVAQLQDARAGLEPVSWRSAYTLREETTT